MNIHDWECGVIVFGRLYLGRSSTRITGITCSKPDRYNTPFLQED